MDDLILKAAPRTAIGKRVKQLRREGLVPGIVYGPVVETPINVAVEQRDFEKFYKSAGHSTLFRLEWDSGQETVFIHEVQIDPVRRNPVHIGFFAPNLRVELTAFVPVVFQHANHDAAGILSTVRSELEVRGLPTALPHQLDADISHLLEIGDHLRAGDVPMPPGVTLVSEEDELLVHLVAEAVEEVEEVAEVDEDVEAPAEAETPAEEST